MLIYKTDPLIVTNKQRQANQGNLKGQLLKTYLYDS